MKLRRLFVFAVVFSVSMSPAIAQQSIRLHFEVVKNGSTVARPEVSVDPGSAASIAIDVGLGVVLVVVLAVIVVAEVYKHDHRY